MRFKEEVLALIGGLDTASQLSIHDSGTDLDIVPCLAGGSFSKGQGARCLDEALDLDLGRGPNLVCGDTASDLPMVEAVLAKMSPGSSVAVLFVVTAEQRLRSDLAERVLALCSRPGVHCALVPSPDVVVAALAAFTASYTRFVQ